MDAEHERREDGGRKPYEPPRITSEEIFETTALACGKMPMQGGKCATRSKAS